MLGKCARAAAVATAVIVIAGCEKSWFYEEKSIGPTKALVTSADVRTITSRNIETPADNGNLVPKDIVCAEPSPDIMKTVQTAFGAALGVGIASPTGVSGQGNLAISRSHAESAAQLGERLATIQLLRDGLFRACEAYANGAISDTTYAIILSRYDDTMVSMLLGELAAGNFGRSLATLGGTSQSDVSSKGDLDIGNPLKTANDAAAQSEAAADQKAKEVEEAEKTVEEKKDAAETAEGTDKEPDAKSDLREAEDNLEKKKKEQAIANDLKANTKAIANAVAAGALQKSGDPKAAETLGEMQRKYIENINYDALFAVCLTALAKDTVAVGNNSVTTNPAETIHIVETTEEGFFTKKTTVKETKITKPDPRTQTSALTRFCLGPNGNSGMLKTILVQAGNWVTEKIKRSNLAKSVDHVKEANTAISELKKALSEAPRSPPPGTTTPKTEGLACPAFDKKKPPAGLLDALKKGGTILALRHAQDTGGREQDDCTTPDSGPGLHKNGKDVADKIAKAFKAAEVPVTSVSHSPLKRTKETATTAFDAVVTNASKDIKEDAKICLDKAKGFESELKARAAKVKAKENAVLVTHSTNLEALPLKQKDFKMGDGIVVKAAKGGKALECLGRINRGDWENLK